MCRSSFIRNSVVLNWSRGRVLSWSVRRRRFESPVAGVCAVHNPSWRVINPSFVWCQKIKPSIYLLGYARHPTIFVDKKQFIQIVLSALSVHSNVVFGIHRFCNNSVKLQFRTFVYSPVPKLLYTNPFSTNIITNRLVQNPLFSFQTHFLQQRVFKKITKKWNIYISQKIRVLKSILIFCKVFLQNLI